MKILITGNSGCGKSTQAKKIAKLLNYRVIHLDDIVWDNGKKRDGALRKEILSSYLNTEENQVFEGSSHSEWMHELYSTVDIVILLKPPIILSKYRIVKRYVKKKLRLEKGHEETLKYVKKLFKIFDEYEQNVIPEIINNPLIKYKLRIVTNDRKTYKLFV
ncbi:MAG: hypothetical protein J6A99_04050 [Clostridia bacterium]|nr:hypothetical protein [Clostridia bacterium]